MFLNLLKASFMCVFCNVTHLNTTNGCSLVSIDKIHQFMVFRVWFVSFVAGMGKRLPASQFRSTLQFNAPRERILRKLILPFQLRKSDNYIIMTQGRIKYRRILSRDV